jgi:hypothetical protein
MKKTLLTTIALLSGLVALAQGTVDLNNNFTAPGATTKAYVFGADGARLRAAVGRVEVLSGDTVIASGSISAVSGLFALGNTVVAGTAIGSPATLTIRAWDITAGATYDTAVAARGSVTVTTTGLGGGTALPGSLNNPAGGGFTGLTLVPEPSTVALAALGLVGLVFAARRK